MSAAVGQVYEWVADAIRRGVYPPGSRLPGERELAAMLEVSRTTLRQALSELADAGRLRRSAQRGWFVPRPVVGEPPSVLQSFTEMARARGLRPTSHILERKVRPATFDEAERLRVPPSASVLVIRRLRGMDDVPICLDSTVLVGSRVHELDELDLEDRSLYALLAEHCGIAVARSSYAVHARAATPDEARLLDIETGAPVLAGDEITYDSKEIPILSSTTAYRGDAYRFHADLYRPVGEQRERG